MITKGRIISLLICIVGTITTFMIARHHWIPDNINFFLFIAFLITSIILIFMIFYEFVNDIDPHTSGMKHTGRKDMEDHFNRMNDLLYLLFRDNIQWGDGTNIRSMRKEFKIFGQVREFIAFIGTLRTANTDILVYYDVEKDDIHSYFGDPSVMMFMNPFHGFQPASDGSSGFVPQRGYYGQEGGPVINVGTNQQDSSDSEIDELVERAQRTLNR